MTTMAQEAVDEETGLKVDLNTRIQFPVSIPVGLKIAIEQYCQARGIKKSSDFALKTLAESVGYAGPLGGGRSRGATQTEQEKKDAAAARNTVRKNLLSELLSRYSIGDAEEDSDDEDEDEVIK